MSMKWYHSYLKVYEKPFDQASYADIIEEVQIKLAGMQSDKPLATVSVIAYNEEKHLLACLWALSNMKCKYPIEIIGVNNNSKDKTEEVFKAVGLPYYNEMKQSCGYARLCGLMHAKGKYHFNADADTLYPENYVEYLIEQFEAHPNVMGISTTWSYIPDKNHSALGIWIYTTIRDIYLWIQSFKRPELSVRGLVFSYHTSEAQKVGIKTHIIRGEDGYLAFQLKQFGRIAFIRCSKTRAITGYGTLNVSLAKGFWERAIKGFKSIKRIFVKATDYVDQESNIIKPK